MLAGHTVHALKQDKCTPRKKKTGSWGMSKVARTPEISPILYYNTHTHTHSWLTEALELSKESSFNYIHTCYDVARETKTENILIKDTVQKYKFSKLPTLYKPTLIPIW